MIMSINALDNNQYAFMIFIKNPKILGIDDNFLKLKKSIYEKQTIHS